MTLGATALFFGALSGFRHAFEPDHLAAVSTMVAERPGSWRAARLGAWWGVGHTAALAVVGGALALLDRALPARLEQIFEFGVAVMLLLLGVRALRRAWFPSHSDDGHGIHVHLHSGLQPHVHVGRHTYMLRPLTIGLVHGLAGSGALTALVMSSLPTGGLRFIYTILFGLASTLGMAIVSGVAGLSIARLTHSRSTLLAMSVLTGTLSIAVSVLWGWPIVAEWIVAR
ncbi:MAG: urease accessory protein [Vicinamibacterales bacterium]